MKKFSSFPRIGNKELLGFELSGINLKIVHLGFGLNKPEVLNICQRPIGALSDEDIAKAIRSCLLELKVKKALPALIIPSHLIITKNIEVPSSDPKEIKEIINLQAGRHTPYAREEIIVDYIEIGTYKGSYSKVLLVIVARNIVKRQCEILERVGVRIDRVFLGAEALASFICRVQRIENESFPTNVIHIDESFSDFIIMFKGKPIFIRSIPVGANLLSEKKEGIEQRFVDEIKKSLEAYQNEDIEKIPSVLVLVGALDALKGLEESLRNSMHLTVKSFLYARNVAFASAAQETMRAVKNLSFLHLVSTLLASEKLKIDLTPEEIRVRKALEHRAKELLKTGILFLAVLVLIFSNLICTIYFRTSYLKRLDVQYQAVTKDSQKLEKSYEMLGVIKNYVSNRGYSLEALSELYTLSTPELQISEIRFDDQGRFTLRGTAETMSAVFNLVESMGKSKHFRDAKTRYTTKRKEGLKDVTDFEIQSFLKKKDE